MFLLKNTYPPRIIEVENDFQQDTFSFVGEMNRVSFRLSNGRKGKYQVACAHCVHNVCVRIFPMNKRFQACIYAYIALDRLGPCK